MRVLQLIDTLEPGGAEMMAVHYANLAYSEWGYAALVATRHSGLLQERLDRDVVFDVLKKKSRFDPSAYRRLLGLVRSERIDIIHAHGTSFFWGVLIKWANPSVRLVWHDHYGDSEFLERRPSAAILAASFFFNGVVSVNAKLLAWASRRLFCKNVRYFPNFAFLDSNTGAVAAFKGSGFKVICLANLRPQKNHAFLVEVARKVVDRYPETTFHLVGKDLKDAYSDQLQAEIRQKGMEENIFFYGSLPVTERLLRQADSAILTSASEGLPVALLEYGLAGLPVVCTPVGEIPTIIIDGENGYLCGDAHGFAERLLYLHDNQSAREAVARKLKSHVQQTYGASAVFHQYATWLKTI